MHTKQARGATILLPSADEEVITAWTGDLPEGGKISNSAFRGADLSSHRWTNVAISRVRFTDCRMMGLQILGGSCTDVLFERCRFDYAVFSRLRVTKSVAFIDCTFTETIIRDSNLSSTVFIDCDFRDAELSSTKMTGADLRGNNLTGLRGITTLHGAKVAPDQLSELLDSLVNDLQINVTGL